MVGSLGKRRRKMNEQVTITFPTTEDLLKAGAQFGHSAQRWHPAFAPFIYKEAKGIHVIDVRKTVPALETAVDFLVKSVQKGRSSTYCRN